MFHWFGVVQNNRGDALPNWQVGLVEVGTQTVVPIFADENGTPIVNVSSVANRAVADENGNYDFYVPNGTYTLQFFNASGVFQRDQRFIAMFGAPTPVNVRDITGTAHTLQLNDASSILRCTNGSAVSLTVPPSSVVNLPIGTGIEIHQAGLGQVTLVPGDGVTINSRGGALDTSGQYSVAGIRKVGANNWIATGDLA